ncbi:MAG TPA: DUF4149 domain-containing protein [Blastocatellia bacterium]|nr:DUF4149 domain-containing protein [Blastocatellia bacterium]
MAGSITTSPAVGVAPAARSGVAQQITAFIELLLLGVWLGSMIFFSFAVAPSAFAVLPTREMAGVMVTSTIGKIEALGLIIGTLLILIQVANWRSRQSSGAIKTLQTFLLLLMIASAALSRFWISPAMVSLQAKMGGHIDDVPVTDPMRTQFNDLHHYSVGLMTTAMISGLVVLFLTVRSCLKR